MGVLTGFDGALYYKAKQIARVRNWSLTVTRDALETTELGDSHRAFTRGLRSATGTATIIYDSDLSADDQALWNEIFMPIDCTTDQDTATEVVFVFDKCASNDYLNKGGIAISAIVTSMTHSVTVGEVQTASIQFQSSGDFENGTTPYPN